MNSITYAPIGVVRSPFHVLEGMPLQTVAARGVAGTVELDPAYAAGCKDLDGFSYIILLVHLHLAQGFKLEVIPFLDDQPRGVFATRSPRHPNPIGLSIVRLVQVAGATLHIEDIDLVDGTPVLDIKPYVPLFDDRPTAQIGWFAEQIDKVYTLRADQRFSP